MTHTTGVPLDAGAASAARQAAVRAAQRCMAQGLRSVPRFYAPVALTSPSVATSGGPTGTSGTPSNGSPLIELQSAIEAYVAELKAAGRPPESTVVLVKQVIAELDAPPDDADLLRREAVRWTIDAYYAP
jgi:hypothetical protein